MTMPAVARGWSSGPATSRMSWTAVGSDGRISTGTGFCCWTPGARTAGRFAAVLPALSRGLVISLPRSLSIVAVRPTTPVLVVVSRSEWIFSVMLVWYPGRFSARCASWVADHRADAEDHREGDHDHGNDGKHAIDAPTAQQQHRRPERKAQKEGEGHRDKDFPPEIERRNGNDADGQGPQTGKRGTGRMDLHPMKVAGQGGGVWHGKGLAARS